MTVAVDATDDRPGLTVRVEFRMQGQATFRQRQMTLITAGRNRYQASIDTTTEGFGAGTLQYHFVAVDAAGNTRRLPPLNATVGSEFTIPVQFCLTAP